MKSEQDNYHNYHYCSLCWWITKNSISHPHFSVYPNQNWVLSLSIKEFWHTCYWVTWINVWTPTNNFLEVMCYPKSGFQRCWLKCPVMVLVQAVVLVVRDQSSQFHFFPTTPVPEAVAHQHALIDSFGGGAWGFLCSQGSHDRPECSGTAHPFGVALDFWLTGQFLLPAGWHSKLCSAQASKGPSGSPLDKNLCRPPSVPLRFLGIASHINHY